MPNQRPTPAAFSKANECIAIDHTPVESSQIKSIGYCPVTNTLSVVFNHGTGATYQYPGVTPDVFEKFMKAGSKGQFFGQHVKALPFKKFAPTKKGA